jgi:uncharacterized Zn finger protein (UPF0148 family)
MKGLLDTISVSIHCPECREPTTKPIRWVQCNQELTCPACQTSIDLDANEDTRVLKKLHNALDRLDKPLKA